MVSLFENYEQQYSVLTADITAQVGQLTASATKDRRQLISRIEKHVEEAQELLEQMDLESREVDPSRKARCKARLDCYRAELKRLTVDYIRARSARQGALYDDSEELSGVHISNDQQQRLLDNSETIDRTGKKLEEGHKIIIDTQDIGNKVLQDLSRQRETLENTMDGLRTRLQPNLSGAERAATMLESRIAQRKLILYLVYLFILVIIVIAICYWYKY